MEGRNEKDLLEQEKKSVWEESFMASGFTGTSDSVPKCVFGGHFEDVIFHLLFGACGSILLGTLFWLLLHPSRSYRDKRWHRLFWLVSSGVHFPSPMPNTASSGRPTNSYFHHKYTQVYITNIVYEKKKYWSGRFPRETFSYTLSRKKKKKSAIYYLLHDVAW